jgi:hypothetical protein
MTEQDDHAGDAAELAFAELRDEVAAVRRAVGGLPAVIESLMIEGLEAPDYAPSFGALAKDLASLKTKIARCEKISARRKYELPAAYCVVPGAPISSGLSAFEA